MNIYFAYTIRGDKSKIDVARKISNMLRERGHHVMTDMFLLDNALENDNSLKPQEIFDRDVHWLKECDVFVSEVSGSSFGIGFELGFVLGSMKKKAFILYDKSLEDRISRMAIGNTHENCTVFGYSDINDVKNFIEKHF
jgi:hypothetical protein